MNTGQGKVPAAWLKWATSGPGPPSRAAPSTSAATSGCSARYSPITAWPSPWRTVIVGMRPPSDSSSLAALVASASARSRDSSSIVAWTPPNATKSCLGTSARICTVPSVLAARRAAKRNAERASCVSSMITR